jgi:hypothetical protein
MKICRTAVGLLTAFATVAFTGTGASAQAVSFENFEAAGTPWTANGIETLVNDGRGDGQYLYLPYMDFWAAEIRTEDARSGILGDLTRYPRGLRITFDMATFRFHNFFGEDMNPEWRPIVLQLIDHGDPNDFTDDASVWYQGDHIPDIGGIWESREFIIPDPSQTALPPAGAAPALKTPPPSSPFCPRAAPTPTCSRASTK